MRIEIKGHCGKYKEFRVVGEPTAADFRASWEKNGKQEPWCELTISYDGETVTSWGGELWPMAWPEYFEVKYPHNINARKTVLTEAGKALFAPYLS